MSARSPARSIVKVIRLTPPGRGAIATVLLEGPGTVELLDGRFSPRAGCTLPSTPLGRLVVGRFGREPGEDVVVCRRAGESVELHCHGGDAAVAAILDELVAAGAQNTAWQDWVAGRHRDPIAAAAHAALAEARTERTAAILLDQYHGALRRALDGIDEAIRRGDTATARQQVETLLARAELGRHLTEPWRVVLGGPANVGKSSLINVLVGYPRAIVHGVPGTTRDTLSVTTAADGWPIELSDTAGVHGQYDSLQQAAAEQTEKRLGDADLVVLVFDRSEPWTPAERALVDAWPGSLIVHNKSDLPPAAGHRPPGLGTSAVTGEGIEVLAQTIADRLVDDPPPPAAAVPFAAEHIEELTRYRSNLL